MPSRIPLRTRLAFSFGHFQNDLMASMWFSFLLVYLHQVQSFNNIYAGTVLLVGQIADAVATPLIGYEADITSGCCGYTKRKSWHAFGLLCTTCSFPFIFAPVLGASAHTPDWALFVYYTAFVVVFQVGWASVQISHLSLIPQLTSDESEIAGLNGWRYAATGVANLSTYALAWIILSSGGKHINPDTLTHADANHFRNLGFIVTGIGLFISLMFHITVTEPGDNGVKQIDVSHSESGGEYGTISPGGSNPSIQTHGPLFPDNISTRRCLRDWFSDVRFYQVALIYMCTRLYVNISQVYLPMYLTETVKLNKVTIANVPLVCYASSFVAATALKIVDKKLGRVLTYVCGSVFALAACVFLFFIPQHTPWMVYVAASIIGVGGALMLITSLSFVADLIGDFTGSSAFVYGAMSFTDKLVNGAAIEVIQLFHPCVNCCLSACQPYYRHVQSLVPGGATVIALIGLGSLALFSASIRSKAPPLSNGGPTESRESPSITGGDSSVMHSGDRSLVASGDMSGDQDTFFPPVSQTVGDYGNLSRHQDNEVQQYNDDEDEDNEDAPLLRQDTSGTQSDLSPSFIA